jgi:hypothetical protein
VLRRRLRRGRIIASSVAAAFVAVLVVCGFALHQWQIDQPNLEASPATLLTHAQAPFGDYRPAVDVLLDGSQSLRPVSTAELREALALTRNESTVDLHLALLRDAVASVIGRDPDAVANAEASLRQVDGSTAPYVPDLATVMLTAGDGKQARALLRNDIAAQRRTGQADPNLLDEVLLWAHAIGRGQAYSCERAAAAPLLGSATTLNLPAAHAQCRVKVGGTATEQNTSTGVGEGGA